MKKHETIIILREETNAQSWKKDAASFSMIVLVIGVGVALDSAAMQWVGFLMLIFGAFGIVSGAREKHRKTISEARAMLDELEREK